MTTFQGILLGILQGIAEFLPISSSGHLQLVQHLFGLGEVPLLFDVFLHLATLCSVVLYFRRPIIRLVLILVRWVFHRNKVELAKPLSDKELTLAPDEQTGRKMILMLIVSTIITGAIGVATSKLIPEMPLKVVCCGFLVTSVLLVTSALVTKKYVSKNGDKLSGLTFKQAIIIGVAQGIGTLPGISRSGSTIAGAQYCGVDRKTAGDYSFVVSIPAILGAFLLELKDLGEVSSSIGAAPVIAGCAAAFASGYIALTWLMKLIHKGKLEWFAVYLIPLAIAGIIFF